MEKANEKSKKKRIEDAKGGEFDPTWLPVDENCPECNKGNECLIPMMKGHYNNCCDCKHFCI